MPDDPIPLEGVFNAIEEHIKNAIPGLAYVGTMPDKLTQVDAPAIVVELVEFEAADKDPGTGETAVDARFEARVLVGGEEEGCLHIAAFVAAQLAVLLRVQVWGLAVEPSIFVRAAQDWTRPELDGFAVWVVEWTQVLYLGEEQWPWPIQPPGTLVLAVGPDSERVRPEELQ